MKKKFLLRVAVISLVLVMGLSPKTKVEAYYGLGMMGGMYGLYGGMMGLYGLGMMGGMYGLYGGMMGMYGMYGMSSLYGPFSIANMYFPVSTAGGLTYQIPFLQIAPLLGMAGMYYQLFPSLFNPYYKSMISQTPPTPAATATAPPVATATAL